MPSKLCCAAVVGLAAVIFALDEQASPQALIDRNRQEKAPVWTDGDTATFFYRGEAEQVEVIFGGDTRPLSRVADSDVWRLVVKLPDLDRAVFSYSFIPTTKNRSTEKQSAQPTVWRGPKAPPAAVECAKLKGTLKEAEVESRALNSRRKVTIYLPPGHDLKKKHQVIYATDGQAIDRFAGVVESLIVTRQIPPVVLIGVHHGGYVGDVPNLKSYDPKKDLRAQEYFPGLNEKRFSEHESFFCTEVPDWAEKHFGVFSSKRDRAVFGYSNGGRFAVEMGLHHPEIFGHVFGFSVAGNGEFDFGADRKNLPSFQLAAGTWETSFHRCTSRLADQLKDRGASVRFISRVGGHDTALWRDEFASALVETFGNKE